MAEFWNDLLEYTLFPQHLQGQNGKKLLNVFKSFANNCEENTINVVKSLNPLYCDASVLPELAAMRDIPIISGETTEQLRNRLFNFRKYKAIAGTNEALKQAVVDFGFGNECYLKSQNQFDKAVNLERHNLPYWLLEASGIHTINDANSVGFITNDGFLNLSHSRRFTVSSNLFTSDMYFWRINSTNYLYFRNADKKIVLKLNGYELASNAMSVPAGVEVFVQAVHLPGILELIVNGITYNGTPQGPIVNWSPLDVAGILAFYDANSGITLNNGNVSAWNNIAGSDSGRNASQPTSTYQPVYTANDSDFANNASITFSGARALPTGTWSSTQQITTDYYVIKTPSVSGSYYNLLDGFGSSDRHSFSYGPGTALSAYGGGQIVSSNVAINTLCVICAIYNGTSGRIFCNNSSTPIASGNIGSQQWNRLSIGNYMGSYPFLGKVAAIGVYSGVHDDTTRAQIMQYLGNKYAISVA